MHEKVSLYTIIIPRAHI